MSKAIWLRRLTPFLRPLCLSLLLASLLNPAQATVMRYLEIEELTRLSTAVFHGQVISTKVYWDENHTRIFTAVRVQVNESLKGTAKRGAFVTITQLGGELDGLRLDYGGRPVFEVGESIVLFTKPGDKGELLVVGLKQGKLRIAGDEVIRDFSGLSLVEKTVKPGQAVALRQPARAQTRLSLSELRQRVANAR
jgi:hypothetical protein